MNDPYVRAPDALEQALQRLEAEAGFTRVAADGVAAFAASGANVLLLTADPARHPEAWDMVVVLPEVLKVVPGAFRAGVADPAASRDIATAYSIGVFPALLFQRDGAYVGAIEGMRDWMPLVTAVRAMHSAPAGRRPGVGIPVRGMSSSSSCH